MTPGDLAQLHAACFITPRPWSAAEFDALLAARETLLVADPHGFALGRVVVDEAELLTMAVAPAARRQGLGRRLLDRLVAEAYLRGAADVFLEVAADNAAALALYRAAGFVQAGRRRAYYTRPDGTQQDALVLRRPACQTAPNV